MGRQLWLSMGISTMRSLNFIRRPLRSLVGMTVCPPTRTVMRAKNFYAYEMVDQLEGEVPDWVIHPTAGGTGIYAMWKGFHEFRSLDWIQKLPRLVASQSEAAAPITYAFTKGLSDIEPMVARATVAESIQVGNPVSLGWRALAALPHS